MMPTQALSCQRKRFFPHLLYDGRLIRCGSADRWHRNHAFLVQCPQQQVQLVIEDSTLSWKRIFQVGGGVSGAAGLFSGAGMRFSLLTSTPTLTHLYDEGLDCWTQYSAQGRINNDLSKYKFPYTILLLFNMEYMHLCTVIHYKNYYSNGSFSKWLKTLGTLEEEITVGDATLTWQKRLHQNGGGTGEV